MPVPGFQQRPGAYNSGSGPYSRGGSPHRAGVCHQLGVLQASSILTLLPRQWQAPQVKGSVLRDSLPFHSRQAHVRAVTWATEVGGSHGPLGFDACARAAHGLGELHSPGHGVWWRRRLGVAWQGADIRSGEGAQRPAPPVRVHQPELPEPHPGLRGGCAPQVPLKKPLATGPRQQVSLLPSAFPKAGGRAESPNAVVTGVAARVTGPQAQ